MSIQLATAAGLQLFLSFAAFAQTPAFDVASVKQAPPSTGNFFRTSLNDDPGMVNYSNATLKMVMERAYNVKGPQISGPDWLNSERYDIVAKVPSGVPKEQIPLMLQTLLADRFKLSAHREKKVLPVYELVVGKSGAKLKAADAGGGLRMEMGPKGRKMTGKVSVARLTDVLANMMDRPVVDMTGLSGTFDIELNWTPDASEARPLMKELGPGPNPEPAHAESSDNPSIFVALQEQLGLRLEAKRSPVDILVVDHIEKVPTEN